MKTLMTVILVLVAAKSFSSEIKLDNLPQATKNVLTLVTQVDPDGNWSHRGLHDKQKNEALADLKIFVENELKRQVVDSKCSHSFKKDVYNQPDGSTTIGLESKCTISFL